MHPRIYAWVDLNAWHTDPHLDEGRHAHTWRVTVYLAPEYFVDLRAVKAALALILGAWEGTDLPPELWSDRQLAEAVFGMWGNGLACGVRVERAEGFGACVGVCS